MAGLCFLMLSTISWGLKDSGMCCVEGGEGGNGGRGQTRGRREIVTSAPIPKLFRGDKFPDSYQNIFYTSKITGSHPQY